MRLGSAPDDFALLAPLDPMAELADYTCFGHKLHWLFCRTCGVRCFTFSGRGEVTERDMEKDLGGREFVEGIKGLRKGSLNAHTLEAGQEALDLRSGPRKKRCYIWIAWSQRERDRAK